ncbi:MAG: hypothetical protein CVV64_17595 [Candidatus Wallbacteria bacterium HGW-Wallbacteria-1]|jgi:hypothetical protein|uniref:Tetratricopeptide repeat protein n=1 Tax=Candidatus Wallbacteria bacterium HGW-Wallbacteria-1 TaxID=2013854 RepID=A0A2N1PK54_9BACT|nr:MAG: hypothetical protein CVV64_17595 [Candidatus Wallbacteria bacterium HGW-Wallbacteria-1]
MILNNSFYKSVLLLAIIFSFTLFPELLCHHHFCSAAFADDDQTMRQSVPLPDGTQVLKVLVDGRRYLVDSQGGVTDPVLGRDVLDSAILRKARYAGAIAYERILTSRALAGNRFSPEKARLLRVAAMVKPSWKGMAAVLFQDRRLFEGVIRDGGPVPGPIVDFLLSVTGRRNALRLVRYIVRYPVSSVIMAAGDAFKGAVDAYCENIELFTRVRMNSSITYEEARKFLGNESFKEYLPLVSRLLDSLDLTLGHGLMQEAREIEERSLSADYAAFTPFALDAGPISILEREMWSWDQWRTRPLLWSPVGLDWWSLSSSKTFRDTGNTGFRITRDGTRVAQRDSRYGILSRRMARSRDVWDAYRWTWDAVDWLSWRTRRWRLLSLRSWLLDEHKEMILEKITALEKDEHLGTMPDSEYLAKFEPILRESLRRLGTIEAYRDFMADRLRITATYSKVGAWYMGQEHGRLDPSQTPSTWWGGIDPFREEDLFGREDELLRAMKAFPEEMRARILEIATDFTGAHRSAMNYISRIQVSLPEWLPGNPAMENYSEAVEKIPPTRKFEEGKRVLQEWVYPVEMDWSKACAAGLVTAIVEPGGTLLSDNTVTILFTLRGTRPMHLFLPAGTMIQSRSSFAQDLIVRAPGGEIDEGFEDGYLVTLAPDTLPFARVAVEAFATDPVLPMPNPATPMILSAEKPSGRTAAIARVHARYRLETGRIGKLMSLYPDLVPAMKKVPAQMISSVPFFTLACQFALWAEIAGLGQGNLQSAMERTVDNDGRLMTLSRVRAQAQAMGGCVRAILRESGFSTEFMTHGRDYPEPGVMEWPRGSYFRAMEAIKGSEFIRASAILKKLLAEMEAEKRPLVDRQVDFLEVKTLLARAILSAPSGDVSQAAELFSSLSEEALIDIFPLGAMCLGAARIRTGESDRAIAILSRAAAAMGDRIPEVHYHLGIALATAGKNIEAIRSFAAFLKAPEIGSRPFSGPMNLTGRARTWMILLAALLSKGV